MSIERRVFDNEGNLLTVTTHDEATDEWVVDDGTTVTRTPIDTDTLADILVAERRQLRAQRLADAVDSLKGPMDPTATIAALRSEVVALRIIIRDLVDEDA